MQLYGNYNARFYVQGFFMRLNYKEITKMELKYRLGIQIYTK